MKILNEAEFGYNSLFSQRSLNRLIRLKTPQRLIQKDDIIFIQSTVRYTTATQHHIHTRKTA